MTNIGKGIVLANMALSFIFLGLSTLVYTTKVDLPEKKREVDARLGEIKRLQTELSDKKKALEEKLDIEKINYQKAKDANEKAVKAAASQQQGLETETKQLRVSITERLSKISDAQKALVSNREEVRKNEATLEGINKQIGEQQQKKFDLENKLGQQTNELNTLKSRAAELENRAKQLETQARSPGEQYRKQ